MQTCHRILIKLMVWCELPWRAAQPWDGVVAIA
jgi:hypothetical protein